MTEVDERDLIFELWLDQNFDHQGRSSDPSDHFAQCFQ